MAKNSLLAIRAKAITKGIDLYRRFREEEPEYIDTVDFETPTVGIIIGSCDTIEYTTRRAGKIELYRHEFDKKSRPLLCSTFDGEQVFLVGGRYNFTEDGITDY